MTLRPFSAIAALAVIPMALSLSSCGGEKETRTINAASVDGKATWAPEVVTVKKGDKVDITVGNTTDKTHGFTIEGYGVDPTTVDVGKPIQVKFTAEKSGTFRIFCQLHPAHQAATFQVD